MKVIVAYQGKETSDHPGTHDGFESAVQRGEIDYYTPRFWRLNTCQQDWVRFWADIESTVREHKIDWLLLHHFHDRDIFVGEHLAQLKKRCPWLRVCVSLGDPFGRFIYRVPSGFVAAAKLAEIVFLTGLGYLARQLARQGVRNMILMPLGYCQVRFGHQMPDQHEQRDGVVFVGNRRLGTNPFHEMYWSGRKRVQLIEAMDRRYGKRFHLYGRGWDYLDSARGTLPFDQQGLVYSKSELVFGGFPAVTYEHYTSNRHFMAMASGAPTIEYRVRGLEYLLEPDEHWYLFNDQRHLFTIVDSVLDGQSSSSEVALAGMMRVRNEFTQTRLVAEGLAVWRQYDEAHAKDSAASPPILNFVQSKFQSDQYAGVFVLNWLG